MDLSDRVTIAVDAMTAENVEVDGEKITGIDVILRGVESALPECHSDIILVGKESVLEKEIKNYKLGRIMIEHASDIIDMHENPKIVNRKKDSSVVVAASLVANDRANVFLSAGNTGASVMASSFYIGRIESGGHKAYPCITLLIPTKKRDRYVLWLDGGAITSIGSMTPENILKSAIAGAEYARYILNVEKPLVALHNVGKESWKGPEFLRQADKLLHDFSKNYNHFDYYKDKRPCGFIEANDVLSGLADVVVTDGYVGNSILKAWEGAIKCFKEVMLEEIENDMLSNLGKKLIYFGGGFQRIKERLRGYGGAHVLGFKKPAVILHGSTTPESVTRAILFAEKYHDVVKINEGIEKAFNNLDPIYSKRSS